MLLTRLLISFPHPFREFIQKIEFTTDNYAISLNHARNALNKPLQPLFRPFRDNSKRFIEITLDGPNSMNQSPKLVESFQPRKCHDSTILHQALSFGFSEQHNSIDFLRMQNVIDTCGCHENNKCRFQLAPQQRVVGSRFANCYLLRLGNRSFNFIAGIAGNGIFKKTMRLHHNTIIVDHPFNAIHPKQPVGAPFVASCADVANVTTLFDPTRCNSSSAAISSSIAIIDNNKNRFEIEPTVLDRWLRRLSKFSFSHLILLVLDGFNLDEKLRRLLESNFNQSAFRWRPLPQPRKNSHNTTPKIFSNKVCTGYLTPLMEQAT